MNEQQEPTDIPRNETSESSGALTHAHSFALRQSILSQLNTSQKAEHDSLNEMREISRNHTRQILQILTEWLCSGYSHATDSEIDEVQKISGLLNRDWISLVGKENKLDLQLKTITDNFNKAEDEYKNVAGFMGKIFAKGDELTRIIQAETRRDDLKHKKIALENELKVTNGAIKVYGDTFIENCCKNLDQISEVPPLGEKLHRVIRETKEKISEEWFRHCQQQQQELVAITKNIECLANMYSIEVQS